MKYLCAVAISVVCVIATPSMAGDIPTWSGSASGNTQTPPNGAPENIGTTKIAGTIREIMASVKRWYSHTSATTSTGSANAQVITYSPSVTTCVPGEGYTFFPGYTNTGATTLTVGACSAPIKIGNNALAGGELVAGRVVMVFHNGSSFQLLSGGNGGGGSPGPALGANWTLYTGQNVTLFSGTPITFYGN